ncbi:HK97 family phage major capsid protein [Novosphingobium chloroacetimidivorans]|uniref:HK97 family phage major capsid protein n=1 Tax=Novosphingobium chloroacetimidivorans TaxID=1428314 RepID=A0A7W7NXQ9_9SPHN|nr:phage major capsid protein [Novosphingobium chloroacetimidivorans]MBB4859460.1 HK97 family phage major capsid protein [Novosphingobium chloroacetimidivorans]
MNTFELRAKALEISNKAALVIAEAADAEKLAEAQRMLDEADALEARAKMLDAVEARAKAHEAAVERLPVEDTVVEQRGNVDASADAFRSYLRGDIDSRELRAAGVATEAGGGHLVPKGFVPELIKALKAYGPMNEGGPVTYLTTASGNPLSIPSLDDTNNKGALIAEGAEVDETNVAFGQKSLGAYKFTTGVIKVSSELLQDAAIDPEKIVREGMAERLGRILNEMLTVGTGTGQPQGIATGASAGVTSAAATAISYDDFVKLLHSVDPAYRDKAEFMFGDPVLLAARLLKDGEGRPLWQPGMVAGAPATILGRPYHINPSMAGLVTGAVSALAGDFSKFTVRKVRDFSLKRLDERFATSDQVGFVGFGRYDGIVTDSRAIKKLTQA